MRRFFGHGEIHPTSGLASRRDRHSAGQDRNTAVGGASGDANR